MIKTKACGSQLWHTLDKFHQNLQVGEIDGFRKLFNDTYTHSSLGKTPSYFIAKCLLTLFYRWKLDVNSKLQN